jgi:DNA polymerase I
MKLCGSASVVQGSPVDALKERVEQETGLFLEVEHFDWIVFLPLADGFGAYNRYYGRQPDGSIKVRGIAARRHDTPEYVREMQRRMLDVMARAKNIAELGMAREEIASIYREAVNNLPAANPEQMAINRRISRLTYAHRCIEGAAVQAYRDLGIGIAPGMKIQYVVTDARRYQVEPAWCAKSFDLGYYRELVNKVWKEIYFAFSREDILYTQRNRAIIDMIYDEF